MLKSKFIILTAIIFFSAINFPISADLNKRPGKIKDNEIDKFQAHEEVNKLQKENLIKLNLIEIISKNFGYTTFNKLKRDYSMANIHVSKKQIIKARELLKKNKQDLDEALRIISNDYHDAAQKMLDECIDKINELEFIISIDESSKIQKKTTQLRDKIKIANQQFDDAYEAFLDRSYVSSITLYRSAKSYAINILIDIAGPDEKNKIDDKFKLHIVDNRNEIFKKG